MGAVYQAFDTKLQRDPVIKVRPCIAAIYGVEERALIMEFALDIPQQMRKRSNSFLRDRPCPCCER